MSGEDKLIKVSAG